MYIHPSNRETDETRLLDFVRHHPFGILVSSTDGVPVATHLPFEIVQMEGKILLRTHLARANKHWKQLNENQAVLAIFGGPQAYISPRWYDHVNVPTMNYIAVHAYGKPRLVHDAEEVYQLLKSQIEQHESHPEKYNIQTLPPDFLKAEMRGLVGLEISVDRWEGNFKLSQNRDEKNYRNIVDQLEKTGNATGIVEAMKDVYDRQGYKK